MDHVAERVSEREAIADGIELWNEVVPDLAIDGWHVERSFFAPFDGVGVRPYAVPGADGPLAFAVVKRLEQPTPTFEVTDTAWLSLFAFSDRAAGETLLANILDSLRAAGVTELSFAGAPQHLFAGVPTQLPDSHVEVLIDGGLSIGNDIYDLERELSEFRLPDRCREIETSRPDLELVRATGHESELYGLLETFSPRWRYEGGNICRRPGGATDYWLLRENDRSVAFVRANRHDGPYRGPNLNWGSQFHPNHCGVGPLGVHEDYRGEGLGLYVTAAVTERLAEAGYDHCLIDWTHLVSFYEQLGFETFQEYRGASFDLTD